MRRWWIVLALLLSMGINIGILATLATRRIAVARAPEPPPDPDPAVRREPPLPKLNRLADHLGLAGEARRRFLERQRRFHQESLDVRFRLAEVRRELRRELAGPEPDRQRLDALVRQSADLYLILERALVSNVVDSRALLDPEQEQEFLRILPRLPPQGPRPGLRDQPPAGPGPRDRFPDDRPRRRRPPRGPRDPDIF